MKNTVKKARILRVTDDELAAIYEALFCYENELKDLSRTNLDANGEIKRTLKNVRAVTKKVKKTFWFWRQILHLQIKVNGITMPFQGENNEDFRSPQEG